MTTPRDLLIVATDRAASGPVERGDLSLALAGAELIDLLCAGTVGLDGGDRILPGDRPAPADRLLEEAASSLARQEPYETAADFLWRRGRDLSELYLAALEAEGQLTRRQRRRWVVFRTSSMELADSPARHRAANRLASGEPVLAALTAAVGLLDERTDDSPRVADPAVSTVLATVDEALWELSDERQRRARRRDDAAVNNVRRGY